MPTSLTDAHLAISRAAAHRPDALLVTPDRLIGAARARMAARLVVLGVASPFTVAEDGPKWLIEVDGTATGLQLTEAGCSAASPAAVQDRAEVARGSTDVADAAGQTEGIPDGHRPPRPTTSSWSTRSTG